MAHVLGLLFGHHTIRVPVSSNRYVCRRGGFDCGVAGPPAPPPSTLPHPPTIVSRGAVRRLHR